MKMICSTPGPFFVSDSRQLTCGSSKPAAGRHGIFPAGTQSSRGPDDGRISGTVLCYDDGTHGDDVPGDGIYHYMDPDNQIGCHGTGAPTGEYRYTFWCEDIHRQRSNDASIAVVRR